MKGIDKMIQDFIAREKEATAIIEEFCKRITYVYENEMSACKGVRYSSLILPRSFTPDIMNMFAAKNMVPKRSYPDFTKDESFPEGEEFVFQIQIINGKLVFGKEKRLDDGHVQFISDTHVMDLLNRDRKKNKPSYEETHMDNVWLYTDEGLMTYYDIMKQLRLKNDRKTFTAMANQARMHNLPIYVCNCGRIFDRYVRITHELIDSGIDYVYRYCRNGCKYSISEIDMRTACHVGDYLVCKIEDDSTVICDCVTESEFKLHFIT